jgi:hypothetical protein
MANENMADVTQGGLSAVPVEPQVATVEPPPVPTKPPISPFGDMDEFAKARANLMAQQQRLMADLEERSKPKPADFWAALARGFSSPDSKLFSGGIGAAAGELQRQQEMQGNKEIQVAQMREAIARQQLGMEKEIFEEKRARGLENAIGNLYTLQKGPFGEDIPVMDANAAKQIAILTKNPQVAQQLIADQRARKIQEAKSNAFKPLTDAAGKVSYQFDPSSVTRILGAGGDIKDIAEIAKSIPDLRRAGMLGGSTVEGTPFDAIALMAPSPEYKMHAERLQKQYKAGAFKSEEDAEKQAQQLLSLITSHMDRQQQMMFQQGMQGVMLSLRQDAADRAREDQQAKREKTAQQLTDQQKIDYRQVVIPIINEGTKASSALNELKGIETTISKAPSGAVSGALASSVGALFGTDENTALRELERTQKSLLAQIPRLPGSQSNFDAKNLEKAIGNLTDIRLTNSQRVELITKVKEGFEKLANRAATAQDYWESNKKIMPQLMDVNKPAKTVVRTGTVSSGPNAGKTIVEYSDGSREYK